MSPYELFWALELPPPAMADVALGCCLLALLGLWLRSRWALRRLQLRASSLERQAEEARVRLEELERARWVADPRAGARRDEDFARLLGSILEYSEGVRGDGGTPESHPGEERAS